MCRPGPVAGTAGGGSETTRDRRQNLGGIRVRLGVRDSPRTEPLLRPAGRGRLGLRVGLLERLEELVGVSLQLLLGRPEEPLHLGLGETLAERDPHPGLYAAAVALADHLDDAGTAPALFVRFELALLAELGFGLDLSECAATGERDDLAFVSPKSGRAVSAGAGAPYMRRLFALPAFLHRETGAAPSRDEIRAGFALTEFFLRTHLFEARGLPVPEERSRFVALSTRNEASPGS